MSTSDVTNASDTKPEEIQLTLRALGEDGSPDNEATADLAKYLSEHGFDVVLRPADDSASDEEAGVADGQNPTTP